MRNQPADLVSRQNDSPRGTGATGIRSFNPEPAARPDHNWPERRRWLRVKRWNSITIPRMRKRGRMSAGGAGGLCLPYKDSLGVGASFEPGARVPRWRAGTLGFVLKPMFLP